MTTLAVNIDFEGLLKVTGASLAGSAILTVVLTLAVVGATRSAEERRAGHQGASIAFGVLMALGMLGVVAFIGVGMLVMLSK